MTRADDIKGRVDCRRLAEHLGVRVARRGGGEWQAHCWNGEAHAHGDRNPSLSIGRAGWRCYASSCGIKGDCFGLVEAHRGGDFKEALRWLSDWLGDSGRAPRPTSTRPTPEPVEAYRPPPARVEIMGKLWQLLEPETLTAGACSWLVGRGIDPAVAYDLGCRDWQPVLGRVQALLQPLDATAKQAAGFYSDEGRPWWPLAEACRDNPRAAGLAVPVFDGEHPHPLGWRWRLYQPGRLKCFSQPGRGPAPLLGLRTCNTTQPAVGEHQVLLVAEGEPDWLSLHQAAAGQAAVLGLVATAAGWRDDWTRHVRTARWVVVMAHDDEGGGQRLFDGLYRSCARLLGKPWADGHLVRWLVDGHNDWNDLLQQGELEGITEGLLAHLHNREG